MSGIFLKFKRRLNAIRTARSVLVGSSVGLASGGIVLILWKLAVIDLLPISSLYIGLGIALIAGGLTFLFGGKKDKRLAEELDSDFGLKARVQTMVEYMGEEGELLTIQRQDAEAALSKIPLRKYKFRHLWLYVVILALSAAVLAVGFIIDDVRNYVPPEEMIPFELSALQESGLNDLIKYVETSKMEEEFRNPVAEELRTLLQKLKNTHTQPEMLTAVNGSMQVIKNITYEASVTTEIVNALWSSDDIYFKHLAIILDTSDWGEPNNETWGDFAEKLTEYTGVLLGEGKEDDDGLSEGKETLKYAIDTTSRKLKTTLDSSGIPSDDELYSAIDGLYNGSPGGLVSLLSLLDYIDDAGVRESLENCFNINSNLLYDAISLNKINANVGEYAMLRLTALFIVPLPEFERPGEMIISSDKDDNNTTDSDGGIGGGATYAGTDLVLDPITGELVEYGKLLDKYNAIMYEKLENGSYTEEQKEAIKKYFALLYSGIKKEEGN
ncbi:MAG: hypothetical protein IJX58_03845 [Clostridia bacterium]|nr:hypothetical protein [Clostridia bacterium]